MKIVTITQSQKNLKQFHQLAMEVNQHPRIGSADNFKQMKKRLFDPEYLGKQLILLAFEQDKPVARLVARVASTLKDENNSPFGYLGFFECTDNELAVHSLFDQAFDWFKQQGIMDVVGPMTTSTWFAHRFNLGPYDDPSYAFEPKTPHYYPALWEDYGFTAAADYYSRHLDDLHQQLAHLKPAYDKACRQGVQFRMLKPHRMQHELKLTYQIAKEAFKVSRLYSDVEETVFSRQYAMIKSWIKKQLFHFAFDKEGNPIGYIYALPDYAKLTLAAKLSPATLGSIDTCNIYSIAVLPEYQRRSIGSALSYLCYQQALQMGIDKANLCMMKEGSPVDKMHLISGDVFRRYRLYQYQIN